MGGFTGRFPSDYLFGTDTRLSEPPVAAQGGTIERIVQATQGTLNSVAGFIFALKNNRPSTTVRAEPKAPATGFITQPTFLSRMGISLSTLLLVGAAVLLGVVLLKQR